ncbi:MAG: sigma-70 family RNA polymerase sigma factor [Candidatus Buchananbacteria bacterium]
MSEINDYELIGKYLKGDEKSLELLIQKYLKPIYYFVYGYIKNDKEAEDITQEVFVRAWKKLKQFKKENNFNSWIFAIAKNASIDFLRKRKDIPISAFDNDGGNALIDNLCDLNPATDKLMENYSDQKSIGEAVEMLAPDYQTVFKMHYEKQLNFREIAEILGDSINTIKSRHRRAVLILKNILSI